MLCELAKSDTTAEHRLDVRGAGMKKKSKQLPLVKAIKTSAFFHKDPKKRTLAVRASLITAGRTQGWKKDVADYEFFADRGELGILQKFLGEDDCETITDGKLFNAYKLALAESEEVFGSLTDSAVERRGRRFARKGIPGIDRPFTKGEAGELVWLFASVYDFAELVSKYAWTPPTLARVRYYFGLVFPRNSSLWPNDKDANHDIARKFRKWKLPLTRGKAGRPRNRGKL
jgi:hypothetical protein